MNKRHLVAAVGTLALTLNLILPGLALGQETQPGAEEIDTGVITVYVPSGTLVDNDPNGFIMRTLGNGTGANLTSQNIDQDSFGDCLDSNGGEPTCGGTLGSDNTRYQRDSVTFPANDLPLQAAVGVEDLRGLGAAFTLTAKSNAAFTSTTTADTIPVLGNFYMRTTSNVSTTAAGTPWDGTGLITGFTKQNAGDNNTAAWYDNLYEGLTNTVTLPYNKNDASFGTAATFTTGGLNVSTTDVEIMMKGGEVATPYQSGRLLTGIAYYLKVPAFTAPAKYTNIVTFTAA